MQGKGEIFAQNVHQRNKWRLAPAGDINNKPTSGLDTQKEVGYVTNGVKAPALDRVGMQTINEALVEEK